jgi:hypothetical protein
MAGNRFKKSIENATENTKDSIIDSQSDNILYDTVDKQVENEVEKTSSDILKKVLDGGKKDRGSNHTIYLSADVGNALDKYAKEAQKSKSTLVDEILREVFKL